MLQDRMVLAQELVYGRGCDEACWRDGVVDALGGSMEDQVPDDVVKDRFDRLLKEVQQISAEVCSVHQGTTQDVLVESVNDHDPSLVTGRMSNNLLVHFPGDESMIGKIVTVYLKEAKGFYYMGELCK